MDEIKFRGHTQGGLNEITYFDNGIITENKYHEEFGLFFKSKSEGASVYLTGYDHMMQYTGLKDKNGKEIYEGDIVDESYINPMAGNRISEKYIVFFRDGCFRAKNIKHHPAGTTLLYFLLHRDSDNIGIEIIGNIYDNPELLKEGADK